MNEEIVRNDQQRVKRENANRGSRKKKVSEELIKWKRKRLEKNEQERMRKKEENNKKIKSRTSKSKIEITRISTGNRIINEEMVCIRFGKTI